MGGEAHVDGSDDGSGNIGRAMLIDEDCGSDCQPLLRCSSRPVLSRKLGARAGPMMVFYVFSIHLVCRRSLLLYFQWQRNRTSMRDCKFVLQCHSTLGQMMTNAYIRSATINPSFKDGHHLDGLQGAPGDQPCATGFVPRRRSLGERDLAAERLSLESRGAERQLSPLGLFALCSSSSR